MYSAWFQAPRPFKCGPRSAYPTTGFWDYDSGREDKVKRMIVDGEADKTK